VIARASKSGIVGTRGEALLVRIKAPPVDGAANAQLIEVLASRLQVSKRAVSIVSGGMSRHKRIKIVGLDAETVEARLKD
jgi:uncharacterized protein (TIGR00251 family)